MRDEDIDVEMPSMDGLTEEEMAEFLDPRNLIINIKLARIIGNIRKSTSVQLNTCCSTDILDHQSRKSMGSQKQQKAFTSTKSTAS